MARVNCVVRGASASRRFAAVRLRRAAAKRFKKVENATAVIWKTLPIAEETFRRLDAPELLADLVSGGVYINGVGDPLDAVPGDAAALRDALDNARPQRGSSCLSPGQSSRNTRAVTPPSGSSSGNRMETSSLSPNGLSMMARSGAVPKCTGRSSPGSPKPI